MGGKISILDRHVNKSLIRFVLPSNRCVVKATSCGCNHEGHYYLPGEVFWADSECNSRCVCDSATQQALCKQRGCKADEHCAVKDGVQDCFPLSFKTCSAQGDPHFRTFDGRKFDFQGNCIYQFASVCKDTKELEKFEVRMAKKKLNVCVCTTGHREVYSKHGRE